MQETLHQTTRWPLQPQTRASEAAAHRCRGWCLIATILCLSALGALRGASAAEGQPGGDQLRAHQADTSRSTVLEGPPMAPTDRTPSGFGECFSPPREACEDFLLPTTFGHQPCNRPSQAAERLPRTRVQGLWCRMQGRRSRCRASATTSDAAIGPQPLHTQRVAAAWLDLRANAPRQGSASPAALSERISKPRRSQQGSRTFSAGS